VVTDAVCSVASLTPHTVNMLDLWRIGMRGKGDSALAESMDRAMLELRGVLVGIIDAGKEEGAFRCDADADVTAVGILGLISGLTMQLNMMKTAPLDPTDMAEKTCELILGGIEVR